MRVCITGKQQCLIEYQADVPHRRSAAEFWQHHLGEHRLHNEQQCAAQEKREAKEHEHQRFSPSNGWSDLIERDASRRVLPRNASPFFCWRATRGDYSSRLSSAGCTWDKSARGVTRVKEG